MKTSEVLNKAADLIQERGWQKGSRGFYGDGGYCILGATGFVAGFSMMDEGREEFYLSPAVAALKVHLGATNTDQIWTWNDTRESGSEVIEVLRAAALIEAAREDQDAAFATYAQNVEFIPAHKVAS